MTEEHSFTERLPILKNNPVLAYALAAALSLLALLVRWSLNDAFPPGYPYVSFFPAVILTTFLLGLRPGIFSAVFCGLLAWYFYVDPRAPFATTYPALVAQSFYVGVVTVDIALVHWMQIANERLRDEREKVRLLAEERGQLAEMNEALFREVQHRVGNNLQMVGSVLSLQMRGLENPEARRAISEAVSRIEVIGTIQRQLYTKPSETLPLDVFISELVEHIMISSGRDRVTHRVSAEPGLSLPPDFALPMALVLSEAIANALEHGLTDEREGLIAVSLRREQDRVVLMVEDDGAGLPPSYDLKASSSLGLRLSRTFARQLDADYSLTNGERGVVMRLVLPMDKFSAT